MKKILLFISLLSISANSFANTEREGFYLKGGVGVNKLNKLKDISFSKRLEENIDFISKSQNFPSYIFGAGYYIDENFRTDMTFEYMNSKFDDANNSISSTNEDGDNVSLKAKGTREADVLSFLINNYIDFNITDETQLFLGGGIGIATVKEKAGISVSITKNGTQVLLLQGSASAKPKINFAYSLTLGASHKITDNAHLELAYSWKDYGKTHPKLDDDGERTHDANRYRGHQVGVGLRFDI